MTWLAKKILASWFTRLLPMVHINPGENFDATIKPDPKAPKNPPLRSHLNEPRGRARKRTPQAPRGRARAPRTPQALTSGTGAHRCCPAPSPRALWQVGWGCLKFRGSQIVLEHISMTSKPKSRGPGKSELKSELQPSRANGKNVPAFLN